MIDLTLLNSIPADCSYDDWLKVGMALKHEGANCSVWDDWSSHGSKYKAGECEKKWKSFNRHDVTGGTLYHIAVSYGYVPPMDTEVYDLHNLLLDENIVDPSFVGAEKVPAPPRNYNPKGDMLEYFTTLFEPDDFVGYCVKFYFDQKEDKWKPEQTVYRRTAGDIIEKLRKAVPDVSITSDIIVRYARAMKNTMGSNVERLYNVIKGNVEASEFIVRENSPQ